MHVPDPVTVAWLDATVPSLGDDELDELLAELRRRGWSEADLRDRVFALRDQPATEAGATSIDEPAGAGATRIDDPNGRPGETVIDDTAASPGESPGETIVEDSGERPGETVNEDPPSGRAGETVADSESPAPAGPSSLGDRLANGATFAGFVIEDVAGRGGMGVVYRARQLQPARTVALKVMSTELASDEGFRERFARESEISASIEHSNVIPVYGTGTADGRLFIAMRYVPGTDLQAAIAGEGRLEPRRAVGILAQVTSALDAAHARGLVHRDVKPANVLLAQEGALEHVYLTDFGLAKSIAAGAATRTGMFVGTIDYAAPEQFEGGPIDARTDVYAAGCMLYHALTGSVPFPADSEAGKMRGHLDADPPSLQSRDPALPPQLDAVIRRAMAKDPDDRYLSAGDLGRAATAALEGKSLTRAERSVATGEAAPGGATSRGGDGSQGTHGLPRWVKLGAPALALAAAAVVAVILLSSGSAKHAGAASAHQSVAACIRAHGMASPSQKRPTRSGESEFQRPPGANVIFDQRSYVSCTSPPGPGANPDGYRAIAVTEVTGPGNSEASGTDLADRFESSCETLRVAYSFGSQGSFARLPPFQVNTGEIWAFHPNFKTGNPAFSQASPIGLRLSFYPTRHEADVLHSGVTTLDDVTCVK